MDFGMLFNDQHYSSAHIDGEILANDITINNTTVDLDGAVARCLFRSATPLLVL